ncbi:hypothetical protein ADUPG1_005811, partial [Aduncisulcus paluster]
FEEVSIDTLGPIPEDVHGFKFLLVCIDAFTRFTEIIPIISTSGEEAAMALLTHVIGRYGIPKKIRSDGGPQFKNELWRHLTEALGTDHKITIPSQHCENGIVERSIGTIRKKLRLAHMQTDVRDYKIFSAIAMIRINRRVNQTTRIS